MKVKKLLFNFSSIIFIFGLLIVWYLLSNFDVFPKFVFPSPIEAITAFYNDFDILMSNSVTTIEEAIIGLIVSIAISFIVSFFMDKFNLIFKVTYPILIISQTIPLVAIAPLLILWMGYGIAPKIVLVSLMCFFPITVGLVDGMRSVDMDKIKLLKSMGANYTQIFTNLKLPASLSAFFSGLKIAASYSVVGAVTAEWLGGYEGLGVYITRVKKSYAFDKMFAVIFLICIISLILTKLIDTLKYFVMKWERS